MRGSSKPAALALWAVLGSALLFGCASPRPAVQAEGGTPLPFIEDDFAQASARARTAGLPLFVEVWAPW